MRILKLIAIGIIENTANKEISSTRLSLGERLGRYIVQDDFESAGIVVDVLKEKENEIKVWKDKWVRRIEAF